MKNETPAVIARVERVLRQVSRRYRYGIGALLCCLALTGFADSDGYYCVGRGYFAHESRGFHTDGAHRLFIIPMDEWIGIGARIAVDLPDFQLHGMRCTPTAITVFGLDTAYEVDLTDRMSPRYVGKSQPADIAGLRARSAARRFGDTPELPLNIGANTPGEFALRVSFEGAPFPGGMEYTTVAKIVRLTGNGALIDSRVIFAETLLESLD